MNISRREFLFGMVAIATGCLGCPIFDGWYADPQIRRYGDTYWVFPTRSGGGNQVPVGCCWLRVGLAKRGFAITSSGLANDARLRQVEAQQREFEAKE